MTITIPKSRHVEIELPSDVPDGEAEVIVLFRRGWAATVPVQDVPVVNLAASGTSTSARSR